MAEMTCPSCEDYKEGEDGDKCPECGMDLEKVE